jgi:hypothetical protein
MKRARLIQGRARRGLLALAFSVAAFAANSEGAAWVWRSVPDYRVGLAVQSVHESAPPGTDPRHAETLEFRLAVSIREEASRQPASGATVSTDVAEAGYTGEAIPLSRTRSAEGGLYEGRVRLKTNAPYRILVRVTPAGGGRTREAQFDYKHHH